MSSLRFVTSAALILTGVTAGAQAPTSQAAAQPAATAPAGDTVASDAVHTVDITAKPNDDLAKILQSQYAAAIKAGRTPVVELGATWCGPCKELAASLGDARMKDAFAGMYIVRLDIDQWKEKLAPLGFKTDGIPAFFPIDETGKAIGPEIDGGAWGDNIPENMAPPLKKFFTANVHKAVPEKK